MHGVPPTHPALPYTLESRIPEEDLSWRNKTEGYCYQCTDDCMQLIGMADMS